MCVPGSSRLESCSNPCSLGLCCLASAKRSRLMGAVSRDPVRIQLPQPTAKATPSAGALSTCCFHCPGGKLYLFINLSLCPSICRWCTNAALKLRWKRYGEMMGWQPQSCCSVGIPNDRLLALLTAPCSALLISSACCSQHQPPVPQRFASAPSSNSSG